MCVGVTCPAPATAPQGSAARRRPRQTAHCAASAPARPARAQVWRHGAALRCCRYGRHGFDHSCSNQVNCQCQHPSLPKTEMWSASHARRLGECETASGTRDPVTGLCGAGPPKQDGTPCSAGSCQGGVCRGGRLCCAVGPPPTSYACVRACVCVVAARVHPHGRTHYSAAVPGPGLPSTSPTDPSVKRK
jgi:hypothetical protein